MYKLKLITKYLFKRRIAWVSLIAVTLCTAMVIVVISVMGGWLNMFLTLNHDMAGDIVVEGQSIRGFPFYQDVMEQVQKVPGVKAVVPVIHTYGLVNVVNLAQREVQVIAYGNLDQINKVNSFGRGLFRQRKELIAKVQGDASLSSAQKQQQINAINAAPPSFAKPYSDETYRALLPNAKGFDVAQYPGLIVGTSMFIPHGDDGTARAADRLLTRWAQLTMVEVKTSTTETPSPVPLKYWIVDDCQTDFYAIDSETVYVPFASLQLNLGMAERKDPEDGSIISDARVNQIQVAIDDRDNDAAVMTARDKIDAIVSGVMLKHNAMDDVRVETWDQHQAAFIDAVKHEKVLLTILFGIISIVAIFLVFCIFYMIVVEKTRDIGIIKSVGATNMGVAQIFLGYGLVIGLIGGGLGLLFGYLIVHNINPLHELIARWMGVRMWDAKTYQFNEIPNQLDPHDTAWIVGIAILSALLGAIIPAVRASRMHPVDSLRFE